jgi:KipI family sensor histidine kinase inhibitor
MITRLIPYGDAALLAETDDTPGAHRLARALERVTIGSAPSFVDEVVVGLTSVVVRLDPACDLDDGARRVREEFESVGHLDQGAGEPSDARHVEVPAVFDGPDLETVAGELGCRTDELVTQLTSVDLTVAFVGFAPGFPYLVGLPPELATVPRRATPRRAVPAGSVAVAGGFASVYPTASPGGWQLLGRTPVTLFDPDHPPYAKLRPGDTLRFADAPTSSGADSRAPAVARTQLSAGQRFAEVLAPGLLTLVQDGGRRLLAGAGVPRAGPCDREAMRLVNRLLGNPDDAAVLELTAVGPVLRFSSDVHLAAVASAPGSLEPSVDGHPVATDSVFPVQAGQRVAIGPVQGILRAYLGVAGGFETPVVVGSRSSDLLSGLGPGPLRTGDRLGLGEPGHPHGFLTPSAGAGERAQPATLRVLPGPHSFPTADLLVLEETTFTVAPDSNRVGLRLSGRSRPFEGGPGRVDSLGMIEGAIQVPPDGDPIVLMPDHATTGGYPVLACVISADLPVLGRLRPGDPVRFAIVDHEHARRERDRAERALDSRVSGWFPTAS